MRLVFFFFIFMVFFPMAFAEEVTYDRRSLIINGTRRILFSGSIHYPRSTPQMWPALIRKAQQGGIDVIQTYVFWNVHEPIEGQYNFDGRYDLVKFIKVVRDRGLYVSLRVGPFIESEWGYGGFPYWLRQIEGIVFRSDNERFKFYMKKYVTMICNMMKSEKLFASQGGPIILVQIENEYEMVEDAFHELGPRYVKWAASMAVSQETGVPWMMCKQKDAPDPVINTCNGMKCGETFQGPNSPNKPSMWTENWTSFYQTYGEEKYIRSAEDIAFNVALFIIAKDGSFVNYYMYHGGTNFGRSASSYVITSYYDEAPIDEYGLIRQPKWGHLKELHAAIKASSNTILNGKHTSYKIGQRQDAHVYQAEEKCVAFLVNNDPNRYVTLQFRNFTYNLPRKSISILPDCKHVSFNTATVRSPYGVRSENAVNKFDGTNNVWEAFVDRVPKVSQVLLKKNMLLDQMSTTKDKTDYLWYTVSYNHEKDNDEYVLNVQSKAHVIHAFVNDAFIGSSHGSLKVKSGPILIKPMALKKGMNTISLLSVMVGLPASGAYLEKRVAGLRFVKIFKGGNVVADLRKYQWGYQVGLVGEELNVTQLGTTNVDWKTVHSGLSQPLVWYKTTFDAPSSKHPLALNLGSMGKGEAWINGESIGRYWVSFKTVKGEPSQSMYHVPQSFLKPTQNALVLFEETGGNPLEISLNTISVDKVCSKATDSDIPVSSFRLRCHEGKSISSIEFASYGSPLGDCGSYSIGSCHSFESKSVVEKACVGKSRCYVPLSASVFGGDPCPGATKTLLAVANCS